MSFKIDFSGRGHKYTPEEISIVVDVMQNDETLTQGKFRDAFEKKFAEYNSCKYAFAVCNATAALELAAQLCQFEPGDEIIAPAHTFTSSVYPFIKHGAKPVWADIDILSRVVTAETIELKITARTKAIIVVHLYGFMVDMRPIMDLARKHRLLVIEDAAQSLGSEFLGQKAGSVGDFGVFSFHSHKNITTLGEGGMLVVRDDSLARVLPMLRHNAHTSFPFERDDYWIPAMGNVDLPIVNGSTRHLFPSNYCLGEVECALGAKLLDRIDEMNVQKRKRALSFIDALVDYPELEFHRVDSKRHNYHLLVARYTNDIRDAFIRKMANEKGIKCVVQYYPLNRYDFYRKLGYGEADCPNTDLLFDNMISFPFQHWMSDDEFDYMLLKTIEVLDEISQNLTCK